MSSLIVCYCEVRLPSQASLEVALDHWEDWDHRVSRPETVDRVPQEEENEEEEEGHHCHSVDCCRVMATEDVSPNARTMTAERTWAHLQLSSLMAVENGCQFVSDFW